MGTRYEEARALDARYLMQTYGRKPVEFVRGEGMRLYDDDGREYLDFLAGIGVTSVGHNHPAVVRAVVEQAQQLLHVSNYFHIEHRGELAAMLSHLLEQNEPDAPGNTGEHWRTFFGNSGAEANEGAIKLARHWGNTHKGGATDIITAKKSFHGRTLATLFATGQEWKQEPFLPEVGGFIHLPLNDIDALRDVLEGPQGKGVAAVMLECIQGESGVWPCDDGYLRQVRELTLEHGILLIVDEVQTGIFRTGKPFAFQTYGIVPDIVTFAKGVGDGMPIAGFCAAGELGLELSPGEHGSTFGGGPLVCAGALATLKVLQEEDIAGNVLQTGTYMRARLAELPHVTEVRGRGLMLAADFDEDIAVELVNGALEAGFVLNSTGPHTLRFLPPLICTPDEVDALIEALTDLVAKAV
ncbi:MAG: aspartate aminotransferase family protein [Actinomycetota bacterium]|nr:aspartate aminotransferase family protein [Actinomycetota bacterium]